MKRTFILLSLFTLISANIFAGNPFKDGSDYGYIMTTKPIEFEKGQKQYGDLSALKGEQSIYVFYYTDDAVYKRHPIIHTTEEFGEEKQLQSEKEVCAKFIDAANGEVPKDFYFSGNKISRYIMKLHITEVDPDGETSLYAMVFDTKDKRLIYQKKYHTNGDRVGTLINLMGDAAKRLGKKVGKNFKQALK